jgi:hypothetical protein
LPSSRSTYTSVLISRSVKAFRSTHQMIQREVLRGITLLCYILSVLMLHRILVALCILAQLARRLHFNAIFLQQVLQVIHSCHQRLNLLPRQWLAEVFPTVPLAIILKGHHQSDLCPHTLYTPQVPHDGRTPSHLTRLIRISHLDYTKEQKSTYRGNCRRLSGHWFELACASTDEIGWALCACS